MYLPKHYEMKKNLEKLTAVIIWQVSKIANSHYQLSLELVSHSRLKSKEMKVPLWNAKNNCR